MEDSGKVFSVQICDFVCYGQLLILMILRSPTQETVGVLSITLWCVGHFIYNIISLYTHFTTMVLQKYRKVAVGRHTPPFFLGRSAKSTYLSITYLSKMFQLKHYITETYLI